MCLTYELLLKLHINNVRIELHIYSYTQKMICIQGPILCPFSDLCLNPELQWNSLLQAIIPKPLYRSP